ncbi:MAG: response regulator [Rhodoferax sp.]|nr:response regulator [Rhodoferax sp.]
MRQLDIRASMLLAALLPVAVISCLLVVVFSLARSDDMETSYQQRVRLVARQLASASEYGLFSGNSAQLQAVVSAAVRESDVRAVVVMNPLQQVIASAGDLKGLVALPYGAREDQSFDATRRVDTLGQPVFAGGIELDDLFQDLSPSMNASTRQLGQIRVAFSRQSVDTRRREMLWLGAFVGVLGLLFGVALAAQLSRGAIRPLVRLTKLIDRIGQGDFAAASELQLNTAPSDPMRRMQDNIRLMSMRLATVRQDLEQQVEQATQALRQKKEEAEQANLAKSRFLAAASHDLRQPTHALGMFVSRLAQLQHSAETQGLVSNLEASVRAMQNLLDGLLDISRLEAQAVQVAIKPFAVAPLIQQLQQDLAPVARAKGLHFRIHGCPHWVMSDAVLLYRILLNLASNSLRYTAKGGVLVACRSRENGTKLQIQVWDTGIGISPEHQQEVFKEFYQVGNVARDRDKGMGLGLSIVQRTAELLGHPVVLTSRLGFGTRVSLTLPTVPGLSGAPPVAMPELQIGDDLTGAHVLVIEDDALVRTALVGLLDGWGMEVHEASGVMGALALVSGGLRPDLVLSDYRLQQGDDGIGAIIELRSALNHKVPACLMSGDTDASLMMKAQASGLTLLHKPVRPAKLRSLLRRLLADQPLAEDLR